MSRLFPEAPALNSRVLTWTVSAGAGAAFAALAGLFGRWSADPLSGWTTAAVAAGLGWSVARRARATDEEGARAWAAFGALAALAAPALLRAAGLSFARPSLLERPFDGSFETVFALGQAAFLAAVAAGCWTRAARGGAAAPALLGAAGAAFGARYAEPSTLLAVAALAVLFAAEILERPWKRFRSAPLRARAFATAAAAGLVLSAFAPRLLRDVWMARLHAAYPGGNYLAFTDDGVHLWAAYRFSNGTATMLRDGVAQAPDPGSVRLILRALRGQRDVGEASMLLVRPPDPAAALAAAKYVDRVAIVDGPPAEAAALDALGGGSAWRRTLTATAGSRPNSALVFLPAPAGKELRRRAGRASLDALRSRLDAGAAAAVFFPPGADERDVAAVARDAAAAFGRVRVADLPRGVLVLAAPSEIQADSALGWRPAPSEK